MANEADLEYGPTPPEAKYEHTDIDPGLGYRFGLWLAVSMLVSAGIVYGTYALVERLTDSRDAIPSYPLAAGRAQEPPTPRLQTQPFKDVYQLKADELSTLHSYGWIDKANGVARIPIDRAMELTLQRGLPARQGGSNAPTMVVQDSSSGRTVAAR
jgi:hypothetical protein